MSSSPPVSASPQRARQSQPAGRRALLLLEEAYCLLRSAPLATLVVYYLGAVPFAAVVFYFWADMSRSSFAALDAAAAALGVALAYGWMKAMQAWFCRRLWTQINVEGDLMNLAGGQLAASLAANGLLQALALPMLAVALVLLVPVAWAFAFFQNATALALTREPDRRPLRGLASEAASLAHWQWGANHLVLAIVFLVGFLVWANLIMLAVVAPQLAKWIFGVESVFTLFPLASLANTTFLFASLLATSLLLGPLVLAIYVLRCFYARSRCNGADLMSRLAALRRQRTAAAGGVVPATVALAIAVMGFSGPAIAQDADAGSESARIEALDAAIEQTLHGKSYQWRLARDPRAVGEEAAAAGEKGWAAAIETGFRRFGDGVKKLFASLFQQGRGGVGSAAGEGRGDEGGLMAMLLSAVSLGLIGALVVWGVVQIRRRAGTSRTGGPDQGTAGGRGAIDLENDELLASHLPEQEWLRLAAEQMAGGDYRLAVRALFLACLAHLGSEGMIDIARYKSNSDYRRELGLKARSLPGLRDAFDANVGSFERAWYGDHVVDEQAATSFAANCELIAAQTDAVPTSPREGAHV